MILDLGGSDPLHRKVYRELRRAILDGTLPAGSRLPPTRTLARDHGISRNVVLQAYDQLQAEGYVEATVGSGTYVASPLPETPLRPSSGEARPSPPALEPRLSGYAERAIRLRPSEPPGAGAPELLYDFLHGVAPPDATALGEWRKLVARHSRAPFFDYAPPAGLGALRESIARYLRRNRAVRCHPDEVVVVNGSQQALDLAARVLLEPGDTVVVEEPCYQGARQVFQAAGARLVAARVDGEGLDPASLPGTTPCPRLVYVTPSHQFPTGAVMPLPRRLALLEWAGERDAHVLEDDYDSEYRYAGRPLEAVRALDRRGTTVYLGTFSKVLFPALRLGFVVVPRALREAFVAAKWLADRHTPALEQRVLADFLAEGHFDRHLRRSRKRHAARREVLLESLAEHLGPTARPVGTEAGIHLLVWLEGMPVARLPGLVAAAARRGVGLYPITPYFLDPPPRAGLLLGYGSLSRAAIREGVRRLSLAVRDET